MFIAIIPVQAKPPSRVPDDAVILPVVKFGVVTVPVNVELAKGAYDANAVVVALVPVR